MDTKTIEINNLRVLNDYLNQTIDALYRPQRPGAGPFAQTTLPAAWAGAAPFQGGTGGINADSLHSGFQQWALSGLPGTGAPWSPALTGQGWFGAPLQPGAAPSWPTYAGGGDPFQAQRWLGGVQQHGYGWPQATAPAVELARQAQINQALAAKQLVLEAMCRAAGISV